MTESFKLVSCQPKGDFPLDFLSETQAQKIREFHKTFPMYRPTPLAAKGKHIHLVGDAEKVGNLRSVIWGAWNVAMKL